MYSKYIQEYKPIHIYASINTFISNETIIPIK